MDAMTVRLRVDCPGVGTEGLAELTRNLRQAILTADVDEVAMGSDGPAPAGAKSGQVLAVGVLIATLAPTVVESLMTVVSSWLSRQPTDVEVEIDGHRLRGRVSKTQRDELVAAYLRRLESSK